MLDTSQLLANITGIGAIVFVVFALIAVIRSSLGFYISPRGMWYTFLWLELGIIGAMLSGFFRESSRLTGWISGLVILSIANGVFLVAQLMYNRLVIRRKR
jgi:hypothetical protein